MPQWENADWLAPQVAVDMSYDDYRLNKDPMLEACLSFSDKDVVLDPMARLRELFMAEKLDVLPLLVFERVNDLFFAFVGLRKNKRPFLPLLVFERVNDLCCCCAKPSEQAITNLSAGGMTNE